MKEISFLCLKITSFQSLCLSAPSSPLPLSTVPIFLRRGKQNSLKCGIHFKKKKKRERETQTFTFTSAQKLNPMFCQIQLIKDLGFRHLCSRDIALDTKTENHNRKRSKQDRDTRFQDGMTLTFKINGENLTKDGLQTDGV